MMLIRNIAYYVVFDVDGRVASLSFVSGRMLEVNHYTVAEVKE